jgi:outer membrane protein TolC
MGLRTSIVVVVLTWLVAGGVALASSLEGIVPLDECVRIALQEHPSLAVADADVERAAQRVNQARSGFLPQIGGQYSFTRSETTFNSIIGVPSQGGVIFGTCSGGTNAGGFCASDVNCPGGTCSGARLATPEPEQFNFHRSGFRASQLLFDFGKTLNSTRAASALRDASEAGRASAEDVVMLNVKAAYYDVIAARRFLVVAEETEAQTRRQLEEARSRYEVGTAPRFDVAQQEVQVADAELGRLAARNAVALTRETLRDAMGLSEPIMFQTDDAALDYVRIDLEPEAAMERAFAHRPELADVRARIRAQQHRIKAIRADYMPDVRGAGDYNWTGEDAPDQESWQVGGSVTLSIFNGGLTTAQVGEGRAELHRLEAEERGVRQSVTLEVRSALLELREAEDRTRVSAKQVDQARENLDIAEGRYSAGVGNILEVTQAQVGLFEARVNHVRALADYWIAVARLERAVGHRLDEGTRPESDRSHAGMPGVGAAARERG